MLKRLDDADIYLGDCIEVLKTLPDNSVDLILTDPPYGTTACKWDTVIPFESMWKELKRVVKPKGAIALFAQEPFASLLRCSNLEMYKYDWFWVKNKCGNFMTAKHKPLKYIENICMFSFGAVNTKGGKGGGKTSRPYMSYFPQGVVASSDVVVRNTPLPTTGINRWNKLSNTTFQSNGKNYPKDFIYFGTVQRNERYHPTQKPVALLEYLIKTYTQTGETVLDFTMGSGSTGVACVNTSRKFIGIELGENYFNISEQRILQAQEAILENILC